MPPPVSESAEPVVEPKSSGRMLVFTVDGQEHALPIESVLEIAEHRGSASVPGSPAAVEGIVALRGRMVTLVDLRLCLERPARSSDARARVVVVGSGEERCGLVVDAVLRVSGAASSVPVLDLDGILRRLL
jgi:purine-binding chemotaxis protein CheW